MAEPTDPAARAFAEALGASYSPNLREARVRITELEADRDRWREIARTTLLGPTVREAPL